WSQNQGERQFRAAKTPAGIRFPRAMRQRLGILLAHERLKFAANSDALIYKTVVSRRDKVLPPSAPALRAMPSFRGVTPPQRVRHTCKPAPPPPTLSRSPARAECTSLRESRQHSSGLTQG